MMFASMPCVDVTLLQSVIKGTVSRQFSPFYLVLPIIRNQTQRLRGNCRLYDKITASEQGNTSPDRYHSNFQTKEITEKTVLPNSFSKIRNFSSSVEKKRNFVSPSGHVMFYLLYKQQCNTW